MGLDSSKHFSMSSQTELTDHVSRAVNLPAGKGGWAVRQAVSGAAHQGAPETYKSLLHKGNREIELEANEMGTEGEVSEYCNFP